jgi:hypothetical protein
MIELSEISAQIGSKYPGIYLLAWEYADAFRSKKDGAITLQKRLRVFEELASLLEKCVFEYDGKRYRTNLSGIKAALKTVCDADKHGFRNHNYLKKVLLESSERLSAEGLTAKEENNWDRGKRKEERETGEEKELMGPEALKAFKEKMGVDKVSDLVGGKKKTRDEGRGAMDG